MAKGESRKLVLLGVGKLALAVTEQVQVNAQMQANTLFDTNADQKMKNEISTSNYTAVVGTTRSLERMEFLGSNGIKPFLFDVLLDNLNLLSTLAEDADILVSFPPDHSVEKELAKACTNSHRVIYISSTGVYGSKRGLIHEATEISADSKRAASRIESERIWQSAGAIVLRSPAIYGKDRGLHLTIPQGNYRPPSNSNNFVSRIHQTDFARIILLSFEMLQPLETYVVGDMEPARHNSVVNWLCSKLKIANSTTLSSNSRFSTCQSKLDLGKPDPEKLEAINEDRNSLRGDRQIDGSKILKRLEYQLLFPTFRHGYTDITSKR